MMKSRLTRYFLSLIIVLTALGSILVGQAAVFAQTESTAPAPTPTLKLDCPYPALAAASGSYFSFDINLKYQGTKDTKLFNLSTTAISGWSISTTGGSGKEVSAVQLTPVELDVPAMEYITVTMAPSGQMYPAPGEYKTALKVSSDTLTQTVELKATVVPQYSFSLGVQTTDPTSGAPTTITTPAIIISEGKDTTFNFNVINTGTSELKNLTLSSDLPKDWKVSYNPAAISSIPVDNASLVTATITPPAGNSAGDYILTFKANNETIASTMEVRVTVASPSFPLWALMIIVAVVVLALGFIYQRFVNKKKL